MRGSGVSQLAAFFVGRLFTILLLVSSVTDQNTNCLAAANLVKTGWNETSLINVNIIKSFNFHRHAIWNKSTSAVIHRKIYSALTTIPEDWRSYHLWYYVQWEEYLDHFVDGWKLLEWLKQYLCVIKIDCTLFGFLDAHTGGHLRSGIKLTLSGSQKKFLPNVGTLCTIGKVILNLSALQRDYSAKNQCFAIVICSFHDFEIKSFEKLVNRKHAISFWNYFLLYWTDETKLLKITTIQFVIFATFWVNFTHCQVIIATCTICPLKSFISKVKHSVKLNNK